MRIYDPRLGRFLSLDPLQKKYPDLTPYQFSSNKPIAGIDLDGLEYSPAGKVGIFAIDATAVQLYHNNPVVILQQKADAPMVQLNRIIQRANNREQPMVSQTQPMNAFEKERNEINKAQWYDQAGYNEDGTPKPSTRLARDKTWNAFANNLALPALDALTFTEGGAELRGVKAGFKAATATAGKELASEGATIGLGLDADLALHRGTEAITYKNAGWQQAGLTKVDWGRASIDNFYFKESFKEAAGNATAIRFDVSGFDPSYAKPGLTSYEFNHIISNPSLLQKTTFIQNGNHVFWNGKTFVDKIK